MIKTKEDCTKIITRLKDNQVLKLYPTRKIGQSELRVCIAQQGCREFWNNESGKIGYDEMGIITSLLWEYRKTYNSGQYVIENYPGLEFEDVKGV